MHFLANSNCAKMHRKETTKSRIPVRCARAGSICCLRAILDRTCDFGSTMALDDGYCPLSTNQIGGGIRKECCECCLMAQNASSSKNSSCILPLAFSTPCRRSFFKCCKIGQKGFTQKSKIVHAVNVNRSRASRFLRRQRQCENAKCEQICEFDGKMVQCACRDGYKLQEDGFSCTDVDECLLMVDNCLSSQRCVNLPGSYKCVRTLPCGTGYILDGETGQCIDIDECSMGSHHCQSPYLCRNTRGSYRCEMKECAVLEIRDPRTGQCTNKFCPTGFLPINGKCQDINECEDGTHRCGDRQCINTDGGYRCLCSAGFDFNETSRTCEDIDECEHFRGFICPNDSFCENSHGSFKCHSIVPNRMFSPIKPIRLP